MQSQAWLDMCDVLDEVFAEDVDPLLDALRYLRHTYLGDFSDETSAVGQKIAQREFIPAELFDVYDTATEVRRLSTVGLRLTDPDAVALPAATTPDLTISALHRLVLHTGMYWYDKGRGSLIDFIAFNLNTTVSALVMWSRDYVNFYPEGDPVIGSPVWNGGPWYPTTHIRLELGGTWTAAGIRQLKALFYDISNYNLVLEGISQVGWAEMVASPDYEGTTTSMPSDPPATLVGANIVSLAFHLDRTDRVETPYYPGPPY